MEGSLWLPEAGLWLDARREKALSFVSHAHADHVAGHGEMICSRPTAFLLRERFGFAGSMRALDWEEPLDLPGHRVTLHPAGHVLGSAMLRIERLSDGASLLYTGDFKLRQGLTAETARPPQADTLVMECTFGEPHYQFPPPDTVRTALRRWCRDALDHGETPVLLGYSLGKAQEIQAMLGGEFPVAVHPQVAEMNRAYEALGMALPPWEEFPAAARTAADGTREPAAGRVLVFPPQAVKSTLLRGVKPRVTAIVSGWAMNAGARFAYQADEAFPLSDHADWNELLELPRRVNPRTVLATHGNSAAFAGALRTLGWNAWSLAGSDQMELALTGETAPEGGKGPEVADALPVMTDNGSTRLREDTTEETDPSARGTPDPAGDGQFGAFCAAGEAVAGAEGRLRKTALLAAYFQGLEDAGDLAAAARFFAGRPLASRDELQQMGAGWALIRHALLQATGASAARFRQISRGQADAGRTAYLVMQGRTRPRPWSLREVQALFTGIRQARGASAKSALLTDAFRRQSPMAAQYVVKILTGDTRLGLKEGLLEEALAEAWGQPAELVREAHMLNGDPGETAVCARAGTLADTAMRPFQPVRVMLASPEESAAAVWKRLTERLPEEPPPGDDAAGAAPSVWLEDKYDGIRAQLHVCGGRVEIYSRDLRSMAREFPDLAAQATAFSRGVVLDGEITAYAAGRQLGFFDLQKRLGRRAPDLFLPDEIPLRFTAFDLLWLDGRALLKEPLHHRRALLEALELPPGFGRMEVTTARSPEAVQAAFLAARARGNEGLIAKDPGSLYAAGRRGKSWLKLKTSVLGLDVVVVAVEQGHGKRRGVLSDYTFAVRDGESGELKVIGKAYSGLTDAEIEELTAHFTQRTLTNEGGRRTVIPDVVLEVAFDSIQPSKRHNSGLSLRFPRIKAIRRDKTAADIDTLADARRLAGLE